MGKLAEQIKNSCCGVLLGAEEKLTLIEEVARLEEMEEEVLEKTPLDTKYLLIGGPYAGDKIKLPAGVTSTLTFTVCSGGKGKYVLLRNYPSELHWMPMG